MSEARTYYGPWIESPIPSDAPDGSQWEAVACIPGDPAIHTEPMIHVGVDVALWRGKAYPEQDGIVRCRRVWPPGSFLPEPRPLVVDGKVRDLNGADGWMFMRGTADGVLTRPSWYLVTPEDNSDFYRFTPARHVDSLLYPVQFFNGALVPVPWPDSGCTTE